MTEVSEPQLGDSTMFWVKDLDSYRFEHRPSDSTSLSPRERSFPGKAGICRWTNLGDGTYLAEFSLQVLPPGDTAELQTVEQRREGSAAGPGPLLHTEQN